ncbi:MAG: DUF2924 domain-containing protein [Sphingopyxis sp.]|uniref:DUF2924 domain-containing protein n=1 Tax=Sphingopyxis sp. TaxID=1908224 RepID=UPI003D6CA02B
MARSRLKLDDVDTLGTIDAREWWVRLYGAPAPSIALPLLKIGLAYRVQADAAGIRNRKPPTFTEAPGKGRVVRSRKLTPGTRLVRDWHGIGHVVTVREDGFDYDGRHWTSLTAIASAITGAKWSGPRFFGLAS